MKRVKTIIPLTLIRVYQLSRRAIPFPSVCRFYPSCSDYGIQAISDHGFLAGSALLLRRLLRCRPGHPGGWDTVPVKMGAASG
ncbi:MAG: membrane protein insertion efficiency factor YidD [Candidatus Omnitrophica bacterium CG11_big_fil_rev_8_21_14_0_20_64_10]|nr:MAG: membrane protein insertion efficiency factor YidD [Candidatus Omnitrophica bacterium CG11_big_fil_rev_8_21_14_0_20_64_10]